jgi:hypothetical protein
VSLKKQVVLDSLVLLIFFAALFLMATSCRTTTPLPTIYPPGWTPPKGVNNETNAVKKLVFAVLPPNVTLTADIDLTGPFDGVNVYAGPTSQAIALIATFGHVNVFPLNLPTNLPSLVEIRTFINWPPPYVVGSVTLDDGTTQDFTNTFYESLGTRFIYVPTNCQSVGLFTMQDGTLQLAGWASTNLTVQYSSDLQSWTDLVTVTNLGAFQVPVDSSAGLGWFRWVQ